MVAPVTGPTTVTKVSSPQAPRRWCRISKRYKQVKPYNLMLPYQTTRWRSITIGMFPSYDAGSYSGSQNSPVSRDEATADPYYPQFQSRESAAISKAVTSFNRGMGQRASVALAMAEANRSSQMIGKRLLQLVNLFKAIKSFDIKGAAKALGMTPSYARSRHREWVRVGKRGPFHLSNEDIWDPNFDNSKYLKKRKRRKAVADLWLEFSFGWAPLVGDIYTAMKVLSDFQFFTHPLRAGAKESWGFNPPITPSSDAAFTYQAKCVHNASVSVHIGGVLTVTNSNQRLLSRLGIVNPGQVFYEMIPFSFVANYFVNIEEWINQFTQYDGVTVSQSWYTVLWKDTFLVTGTKTNKLSGVTTTTSSQSGEAISMVRTVGKLPSVSLGLRPAYYNGVKRAFNNAALLVQMLKVYR